MAEGNFYVVGETVRHRCSIFRPGTSAAVDPDSVTIIQFRQDGMDVAIADYSFARVAEGAWEIDLTSDNLSAGTYTYRVKIMGDLGITYLDDTFIVVDEG